jgi:hypothetical protein
MKMADFTQGKTIDVYRVLRTVAGLASFKQSFDQKIDNVFHIKEKTININFEDIRDATRISPDRIQALAEAVGVLPVSGRFNHLIMSDSSLGLAADKNTLHEIYKPPADFDWIEAVNHATRKSPPAIQALAELVGVLPRTNRFTYDNASGRDFTAKVVDDIESDRDELIIYDDGKEIIRSGSSSFAKDLLNPSKKHPEIFKSWRAAQKHHMSTHGRKLADGGFSININGKGLPPEFKVMTPEERGHVAVTEMKKMKKDMESKRPSANTPIDEDLADKIMQKLQDSSSKVFDDTVLKLQKKD